MHLLTIPLLRIKSGQMEPQTDSWSYASYERRFVDTVVFVGILSGNFADIDMIRGRRHEISS
jgi:hypothetical protein